MTGGRAGSRGVAGARRPRRPLRRAAALALLLALPGCAHVFGGGTGPSGLPDWDHRLRVLLRQGAHERALEMVGPEEAEAGDELLRLQHEALVAHYAGRWQRSSDAVERALLIAEDRYTKSVSKALLSMLASDRVLAYDPPTPERLLLHYYGALNYLRRGDPEEAAVEARRLGRTLGRALDDGDGVSVTPGLGRGLSHFAGVVFEAAGMWNDAAVAYRRARAFGGDDGAAPSRAGSDVDGDSAHGAIPAPAADAGPAADTAASPAGSPPAAGEVVVVVERGFVAHKVERDLTLFLLPDEIETLREVSSDGRDPDPGDAEEVLELARRVAGRAFGEGGGPAVPATPGRGSGARHPGRAHPAWHRDPPRAPVGGDGDRRQRGRDDDEDEDEDDADGSEPVLVRLAWPVYRDAGRVRGAASLLVDGDTVAAEPVARTDLSAAVREAYRDRRVLDLAKTLLRAATKSALAEGIEDAVSDEDETLGEILGWTARIAGALLERADTRSWHLLPARLELYRLRLPAGTHRIEATVPGWGRQPRRLSLGTVDVEPGAVRVVSGRAWD